MIRPAEDHEQQAIAWVIRLKDGDGAAWEAFTDWLEADPAHLAAYEEAALADEEAGALSREPKKPILAAAAPPEAAPRAPSRRRFIAWGAAAAIVGAISFSSLPTASDRYEVATAPGERKQVDLADGSRIDLNGSTRLILDEDQPRFARLEQGEALFTIVHDEEAPFRVEAGEARLVDLGTVFNVVRGEDGHLDLAVAEGAVRFEQAGERLELARGQALTKTPGTPARTSARPAAAITGWRDGRLTYANATVAQIAADLSRNLGVAVSVDPGVTGRRFSGVIRLGGDPGSLMKKVALLLQLEARRSGKNWILTRSGESL